MKKLYENIEDINIKGGIDQLSSIVTTMDLSLQQITEWSDQLNGILNQYRESNKGVQFQNVLVAAKELTTKLHNASIELNEMQRQIVMYQNKIYRYEELSGSASLPNEYLVSTININVETMVFQFNKEEMIKLLSTLNSFNDVVVQHIKSIERGKQDIYSIWNDSQYQDFSLFVDDVISEVEKALNTFNMYTDHLDKRIQGLV